MTGERGDGPTADDARPNDDARTPEADREMKRRRSVADLSNRLRHVCQHLSNDEFARLVSDMAEMKLRFSAIEASSWPRPPPKVDGR